MGSLHEGYQHANHLVSGITAVVNVFCGPQTAVLHQALEGLWQGAWFSAGLHKPFSYYLNLHKG